MVRLSALGRAAQAQGSALPAGASAANSVSAGGPALAGFTAPAGSSPQYDATGPWRMPDQPGGQPPLGPMPGEPIPAGPVPQQSAGEIVIRTFGDNIVFANCEAGLLGGDGSFRDNIESVWEQTYQNASFSMGVDAFKGPIDLFVPNGNFGLDFGVNLGIPLAKQLGIGIQAGASAVLSDLQGTVQADDFSTPTSEIRQQTFFTLGLFQRIVVRDCIFSWGFAHDWLFDDYYSEMNFAQWRVKLGVQWNPWNELGIWAAMPDHGATATITEYPGGPTATFDYRSMAQGNLYWRHVWTNAATTTAWIGVAQEPGDFIFGADAHLPLTERLSLVGNFTYIMPRAIGIEFVPGGSVHCPPYRFSPLMPVADNGSLAVRVLP
jgi:hypothetical protein